MTQSQNAGERGKCSQLGAFTHFTLGGALVGKISQFTMKTYVYDVPCSMSRIRVTAGSKREAYRKAVALLRAPVVTPLWVVRQCYAGRG